MPIAIWLTMKRMGTNSDVPIYPYDCCEMTNLLISRNDKIG